VGKDLNFVLEHFFCDFFHAKWDFRRFKRTVIRVFSFFYPKFAGSSLARNEIEQPAISIYVLGFFIIFYDCSVR